MNGIPESLFAALSQTRSAKPIITVNNQEVTEVFYPPLCSLKDKEGIGSPEGSRAVGDTVELGLAGRREKAQILTSMRQRRT